MDLQLHGFGYYSLIILLIFITEMILRFYVNHTTYEISICPLYRNKTVSIDNDKCIA